MRHGVRISEPASEELTDAVEWYEMRRAGLGAELFDAITDTIDLIHRQPEIGTAAYPDPQTRRTLVERFSYQVVYRLDPSGILVVAIAQQKRRPGYWKHRN